MHKSVLLDRSVSALNIQPNGTYIDGTFGRGGHSQAILSQLGPQGQLIVFDKDPEAIEWAQQHFGADERVHIVHDSFAQAAQHIANPVDGVLLDLGVSSPQLDQAERGFSFQKEGPLDMRMDTSKGPTAAQWLMEIEESALADIIWRYGEERFARRIARAIVEYRKHGALDTTAQLAQLIEKSIPTREKKKHPATRSFQAIRIALNRELEDVEQFLEAVPNVLKAGGRLVVISFHSLEDRLIKHQFQRWVKGKQQAGPRELAGLVPDVPGTFKWVTKRAFADEHELDENIRARSAVLRAVEKL